MLWSRLCCSQLFCDASDVHRLEWDLESVRDAIAFDCSQKKIRVSGGCEGPRDLDDLAVIRF